MQQTFQINTDSQNSKFTEKVRAIFVKKDVKIVIEDVQPESEQEKLLKSFFGSWEGGKVKKLAKNWLSKYILAV